MANTQPIQNPKAYLQSLPQKSELVHDLEYVHDYLYQILKDLSDSPNHCGYGLGHRNPYPSNPKLHRKIRRLCRMVHEVAEAVKKEVPEARHIREFQ